MDFFEDLKASFNRLDNYSHKNCTVYLFCSESIHLIDCMKNTFIVINNLSSYLIDKHHKVK